MKKDKETDSNSDQGNRAPLIVAMVIFVGFFAIHMAKQPGFESSYAYSDFTEEEMAHIDSMRVRLQEAPERSIVTRYDVDNEGEIHLEAIWAWVDSAEVFDALMPGLRIIPGREVSESYLLTIKQVTYPEDSEYDSLDNEFFKANN